jgi:hypothetical protein
LIDKRRFLVSQSVPFATAKKRKAMSVCFVSFETAEHVATSAKVCVAHKLALGSCNSPVISSLKRSVVVLVAKRLLGCVTDDP